MKERPILFNAEMVKAILEGRKTQTRRIINPQPEFKEGTGFHWKGAMYGIGSDYAETVRNFTNFSCPIGRVNDRLWVRETFMDLSGTGVEHRNSKGKLQKYAYAVDCPRGSHSDELRKEFGLKWKPSIHMPRSASRILLEITNIRVEKLQDISDPDAKAEGIFETMYGWKSQSDSYRYGETPSAAFNILWEEINGLDSLKANPWVWVIEFKVIQGGAA